MKQSSKLLFASLLSLSFASFAMDQETPDKPIQSFIEEIKAFNNTELSMYKKHLTDLQFVCMSTLTKITPFLEALEKEELLRQPSGLTSNLIQIIRRDLRGSDGDVILIIHPKSDKSK